MRRVLVFAKNPKKLLLCQNNSLYDNRLVWNIVEVIKTVSGDFRDAFYNFEAFVVGRFAKARVLSVQKSAVGRADKELTGRTVFHVGARHRNNAFAVVLVVFDAF